MWEQKVENGLKGNAKCGNNLCQISAILNDKISRALATMNSTLFRKDQKAYFIFVLSLSLLLFVSFVV